VIRLLGDLVEHFADAPRRIPAVRAGELAAQYVSGMTDRYALGLGVELLGWRPDDLPRGV